MAGKYSGFAADSTGAPKKRSYGASREAANPKRKKAK